LGESRFVKLDIGMGEGDVGVTIEEEGDEEGEEKSTTTPTSDDEGGRIRFDRISIRPGFEDERGEELGRRFEAGKGALMLGIVPLS
jgi:hypothetical protein